MKEALLVLKRKRCEKGKGENELSLSDEDEWNSREKSGTFRLPTFDPVDDPLHVLVLSGVYEHDLLTITMLCKSFDQRL